MPRLVWNPRRCFQAIVVFGVLCSVATAANVLVVLAGDSGGSEPQTDEYDIYWVPAYGNTPFLNADQTGSTFTVVAHDPFTNSIFENAIDPSFDAVWYFKGDDDWDDEPDSPTWVSNLEAFANAGNLVVITGMDVIASDEDDVLAALAGGSRAIDSSSVYAYSNPGKINPFSTDVTCEPLLDGPFGTFYGQFPDLSASGFPGLNDTDGLAINRMGGDEGVGCLTLSDSYVSSYGSYWYNNFDEIALFSIRPMQNGGAIVFMALSYNEYDNIGDGFYGSIVNNLLSYATTAGGGGDPHILGFDKSSFDLIGDSGDVYNIISDSDLQMNVLLWSPEGPLSSMFRSFIGSMAFMTQGGDSIVLDAGDHDMEATVNINGESFAVAEFEVLDSHTFHIEHTSSQPKVPMVLGVGLNFAVTDALVLRFDHYAFEIYFVREEGQFGGLYFLDFTVSLLSTGHNPHGIVGRTLMVNGQRQVRDDAMGVQEDFLVADGLLGTDFRFNRF